MAIANIKKFVTIDNLKTVIEEFKKHNRTIIDVTELPLSNIDSTKIYRLTTSNTVIDQEAISEHSVDYKTFIAGTYLALANDSEHEHDLTALENSFSNFGLAKNTDYFLFPIPGGKGDDELYLILTDIGSAYQKLLTAKMGGTATIYNHIIDWTDKTVEELQTATQTLIMSLVDEDATEEDITNNHAKLHILHFIPEVSDEDEINWICFIMTPNPETGKYTLVNSDQDLTLYSVSEIYNTINSNIISLEQEKEGPAIGVAVDLETTSGFANLSDVVEAYLEESDYELRHFWVTAVTDIEIPEESHIEQSSKLYAHGITGWEEIEVGGANSIVYATNADIDLGFGILTFADNISIEDTSLVADDTTTIDEENHLLDLDGDEYNNGTNPEDNSGEDKE